MIFRDARCARTRLSDRLLRQQADQTLERVIQALARSTVRPGTKRATCHGQSMTLSGI